MISLERRMKSEKGIGGGEKFEVWGKIPCATLVDLGMKSLWLWIRALNVKQRRSGALVIS